MANDAFHRFHMAEAPLLKPVFNVDQFLSELIQVEILLRLPINSEPDVAYPRVRNVRPRKIAIDYVPWHRVPAAGKQAECLIVEARLIECRRKFGMKLGLVAVRQR